MSDSVPVISINSHLIKQKNEQRQALNNRIKEWLAKGNQIQVMPCEDSRFNGKKPVNHNIVIVTKHA